MRLTLLTLMAYLDDVLDPDNAKEIGEKISSSPVAADLAARIKEVGRRRRLRAADAFEDDREFLANSVAEYLDYTLPPAQIPELERKCLNSDERLAEVSACHQILTLFLGKPVEISDKTRERMYLLVDDQSAAAEAVAGKALEDIPSEPLREVETAGIAAASDNQPGRFEDGIPDYLKPRPLWQRLLPAGTIAAVLLVWVYVIFTDSAFQWDRQDIASNSTLPGAKPVDEGNSDSNSNGKADQNTVEESTDEANQNDSQLTNKDSSVAENSSENGKPIVPPPPGDTTESNTSTTTVAQSSNEKMTTETKPTENTSVENVGENPQAKPEVPQQPIPKMVYSSENTVLLKRDDLKMIGGWFVHPSNQAVNAGDEFISPMPFRTSFSVESLGLTFKADAHTRFKILGNTTAAAFGFEILSGRMILERGTSKNAEVNSKPIAIAIQSNDNIWKLELLEGNTIAGIEVAPRLPNHFEQEFGEESELVSLTVVQGEVRVSDGAEQNDTVSAGTTVLSAPEDMADATFATFESDELNLSGKNAWLTKDIFRSTPSRRREALRFAKEFDEVDSVSMTMPAVYRNPDPQIAMYAVKTLALIEKPGDLATALKSASHEEARKAAITGLRAWLPRSPENRNELKEHLTKVFRPDTAITVYNLLWGYNEEDGKDETISKTLVAWLRDEDVAIRELAIFHIEKLTGRTYDYHPLAPVSQRDSIAARWEQHIQKEGALIP